MVRCLRPCQKVVERLISDRVGAECSCATLVPQIPSVSAYRVRVIGNENMSMPGCICIQQHSSSLPTCASGFGVAVSRVT